MIQHFFPTYKRLLATTTYSTKRYLFSTFSLQNRLTGLVGPRGTGKTTLLLQYIKLTIQDIDKCMYTSMDNLFFSNNTLLSFVNELYEIHGIRYLFLDEIHKYPNWNQELKNIYDSYPDLFVVFSGSSSIDLIQGSYDLSRRAVIYRLDGLSFREYLSFLGIFQSEHLDFQDLINNKSNHELALSQIEKLRGHFQDYMQRGYYPFFLEDPDTYKQKLFRVIEKTIFEDVSNFYKLKTENLVYFKRILTYLTTIPPGQLNRNNIAKNLGLDNKTVQSYLEILQNTGLVNLICSNKSGSNTLKTTEKIYLDNPNLYYAISQATGYSAEAGTIREVFFIRMLKSAGKSVFYSPVGDFQVDQTYFEIGGKNDPRKNKSRSQIKHHLNSSFLVKDDILYSSPGEIPLYLFGFLY